MNEKQEFRLAMKERLQRMSARDRETESRSICNTLAKEIGKDQRIVTGYLPLIDEPNIEPLLEKWLQEKRHISLPTIEGNLLSFRHVLSLKHTEKNIHTQLRTPLKTAERTDRKKIQIVLVPGRAFTKNGSRLGRGNGGYDRWISEQRRINPNTQYIGICFSCQIVQELPTEPHDEQMDVVIDGNGKTYIQHNIVQRIS